MAGLPCPLKISFENSDREYNFMPFSNRMVMFFVSGEPLFVRSERGKSQALTNDWGSPQVLSSDFCRVSWSGIH